MDVWDLDELTGVHLLRALAKRLNEIGDTTAQSGELPNYYDMGERSQLTGMNLTIIFNYLEEASPKMIPGIPVAEEDQELRDAVLEFLKCPSENTSASHGKLCEKVNSFRESMIQLVSRDTFALNSGFTRNGDFDWRHKMISPYHERLRILYGFYLDAMRYLSSVPQTWHTPPTPADLALLDCQVMLFAHSFKYYFADLTLQHHDYEEHIWDPNVKESLGLPNETVIVDHFHNDHAQLMHALQEVENLAISLVGMHCVEDKVVTLARLHEALELFVSKIGAHFDAEEKRIQEFADSGQISKDQYLAVHKKGLPMASKMKGLSAFFVEAPFFLEADQHWSSIEFWRNEVPSRLGRDLCSVLIYALVGKPHHDRYVKKLTATLQEMAKCDEAKLKLNWARTCTLDIKNVVAVRTEEEVVKAVRQYPKIRCMGEMHSCAPLVTPGIKDHGFAVLDIRGLCQILEVNVPKKTARFQAGTKCWQLNQELRKVGLVMPAMGTVDSQTIVGAAMTGTHGGSLHKSSIHAYIDAYKYVDASGEVMEIRRGRDHLFSAMAPSFGVFGVVLEAEMRLSDRRLLETRMVAMPIAEMVKRFRQTMKANMYVRVVAYPTIDTATVWTSNPLLPGDAVPKEATQFDTYVDFRSEAEQAMLEEWCRWEEVGGSANRLKADQLLMNVVSSQLQRLAHYIAPTEYTLCLESNNGIPHADMELGFDYDQAEEVLHTMMTWVKTYRIPYYNFEIRCTGRDDGMLSACFERDTMWIDVQAKVPWHEQYFHDYEAVVTRFKYRKHWAKGLSKRLNDVESFENVSAFINLMQIHDPSGKFRNQHVEEWMQAARKTRRSASM